MEVCIFKNVEVSRCCINPSENLSYYGVSRIQTIWNKGSSILKPLTIIPGTSFVHKTTVVTAFFDIGPVKKPMHPVRSQTVYFEWVKTFRYMRNALVVYTDSKPFRKHITAVRSKLSALTDIVMVNRSLLWSFQNLPKITKIYNFRNAFDMPLYTCITHAKFDSLSKAIQDNSFKTKYFMWLDMGYLRHRKSHRMFHLSKPKHFNDLKIAVTQIQDIVKSISPNQMMKTNHRYVAGGFFYGERTHVMLFVEDFKRAVRYFLSINITDNEEPIFTAMYTDKGRQILKPAVELQLYRKGNETKTWRNLGLSMVTEEKIRRF